MSDLLLTTLIAVIAGLVGGYLTGRYASDLERVKWERGRREEYEKETRLAVAELARKLGEAANSMEWITWTAEHEPAGLPEREIKAYNERMYKLWPDIVGAHFIVAASSTRLHAQMTPLVDMVEDLDSKIAKALRKRSSRNVSASDGRVGTMKPRCNRRAGPLHSRCRQTRHRPGGW